MLVQSYEHFPEVVVNVNDLYQCFVLRLDWHGIIMSISNTGYIWLVKNKSFSMNTTKPKYIGYIYNYQLFWRRPLWVAEEKDGRNGGEQPLQLMIIWDSLLNRWEPNENILLYNLKVSKIHCSNSEIPMLLWCMLVV